MRVLQVVTHMNRGGLETMLMNYYRSLDREQVQFDFLTHRPYDGDYGEEIKRLGGKIYHLPTLNPFSASYKKELSDFFTTHPEYQIVHVHQDCLSGVILKVAKACGVEMRIAHSHTANQDKNLKYIVKVICRKMIPKYATELFACGKEAGDWMFCGAKYLVLNNAIDTQRYISDPLARKKWRQSLQIRPDDLIIGHVGRFSSEKNHLFLIEVFNQIRKRIPQAKLLLIGNKEGEYAERIKERIRTLQLTESVIMTGVRSDVADLMQAMDVFVFPSKYEGFGIVALEAQASDLPCIISDKVPTGCMVTDKVRQIPLAAGAEAWAEAVVQAAKNPVRRDTSAEIKEAGFDIAENARWLQDYYLSRY